MAIVVVVLYIMLAAYEFIPLYKQNQKKDLFVNGALFLVSFAVAILLCIGVVIPSPAEPIKEFITSIFGK